MNDRLNAQLVPGTTNQFSGQFGIDPLAYSVILAGFFCVFIAATVVSQRHKA